MSNDYDENEATIAIEGKEIQLTYQENRVCSLLFTKKLISREKMIDVLYLNGSIKKDLDALNAVISRLRKKLLGTSIKIKAIRRLGYKLLS